MGYTKLFITFIAGAAVGAIAGILLAPDKGSSTRQKLMDKKDDFADTVKTKFKRNTRDNDQTGIRESGTAENDQDKRFAIDES